MAELRQNKVKNSLHCIPIKTDLNVEWGKNGDLNMRQLLEISNNSLPFLIQITVGYFNDAYAFNSGDIFWVKDVFRLKVMILKDENCTKISIPLDYYPHNCIAIWPSGERSQPVKLQQIVNSWETSPDGLDILLELDELMTLDTDSRKRSSNQLLRLTIEDVQDELFLVAHSVIDGYLYSPQILLPHCANVRVNVASKLQPETIRKLDRCCAMLPTVPADISNAIKVMRLQDAKDEYVQLETARITEQLYSKLEWSVDDVSNSSSDDNTCMTLNSRTSLLEPLQQQEMPIVTTSDKPRNYQTIFPSSVTVNKPRDERSKVFESVELKRVSSAEQVVIERDIQRPIDSQSMFNLTQSFQTTLLENQESLQPSSGISNISLFVPATSNIDASRVSRASQRVEPIHRSISAASNCGSKSSFTSVNEVPVNVAGLTVNQVTSFVKCLFPNRPEYADYLAKNEIDGDILVELDRSILTSECGFNLIDAIKLEKFVKNSWRPK